MLYILLQVHINLKELSDYSRFKNSIVLKQAGVVHDRAQKILGIFN